MTNVMSSKERLLKLEEVENQVKTANDQISEDEIEKIRREFNGAKQRFLKVPDAVKQMPKMNPEGLVFVSFFIYHLLYFPRALVFFGDEIVVAFGFWYM